MGNRDKKVIIPIRWEDIFDLEDFLKEKCPLPIEARLLALTYVGVALGQSVAIGKISENDADHQLEEYFGALRKAYRESKAL